MLDTHSVYKMQVHGNFDFIRGRVTRIMVGYWVIESQSQIFGFEGFALKPYECDRLRL